MLALPIKTFSGYQDVSAWECPKLSYAVATCRLNLPQLPPKGKAGADTVAAPPRLAAHLRKLGFMSGQPVRILRNGWVIIVPAD